MKNLTFILLLSTNILLSQNLDSAKRWIQQEWTLKQTQSIFNKFGLWNSNDWNGVEITDTNYTWQFSFSKDVLSVRLQSDLGSNDSVRYYYKVSGDSGFLRIAIWELRSKKRKRKTIYRQFRVRRVKPHELVLDYDYEDPFWNVLTYGNIMCFENVQSDKWRRLAQALGKVWYSNDSINLLMDSFKLYSKFKGVHRNQDVVSYTFIFKLRKFDFNIISGNINYYFDSYLDSNGQQTSRSKFFQHASFSSIRFSDSALVLRWELLEFDRIGIYTNNISCIYKFRILPDSSIIFNKILCN